MMQHVATVKSEVAAFATGAQTNSFTGSESNEQFGQLLQDQKSLHSLADASSAPPAHTTSKKVLQQSIDENEGLSSAAIKEDTATQAAVVGNSSEEVEHQYLGGHAEASDDSVSESATNSHSDELKVGNTEAELLVALPSKQNAIESVSIDAQEWVSLVDNLQKLADITRPTTRLLVDVEAKSIDVSAGDLKLPNKVTKGLLEQIADRQVADGLNLITDGTSLLQVAGSKTSVNVVQEEQPKDYDILVTEEKVVQSISIVVNEALGNVLTNTENEGLADTDIRQKTVELLLEHPDILQDLFGKLQIVSQKSDTDTAEQKTLDTTIDDIIKKDSLLANQQVETGGQADLTLAENQVLLRTLLVDSETDKTRTQESVKLAKPVLSDTPERPVQVQQVETLVTTLESVAEQGELLDQDVQMAQVAPSNSLNSSKIEKVTSNNNIKNILNLADNKLDKVLDNIAQRVFDSKKSGELISPEQLAQQIVIPKAAEIISSVDSSSKDFISALKSGLNEFKNQLSQGREPGIDLKALVSEALAKVTDTGAVAKAPVNLEQMVNSVSQVLDFAQTMNRAIEHHHDQVYSATLRDVAQIQGEQSKQIQLNQFESKLEKAINIAKPEGHQQLAEKVRWMVNTKNLVAEIRLDPAELGSVHVKVAMSGESATVNFVVQSQQARDAVDTATPRLREMLAEKGIELGQSSVRQESDRQQDQGESARQDGSGNGEVEDVDVPEQVLVQQNIVNGALGGIDYFV